jgi:hypothetical protein
MEDSDTLLLAAPLLGRAQVLSRPCPIPAASGVYGWWFYEIPSGVPTAGCMTRDQWTLLYVGISPKAPAPQRRSTEPTDAQDPRPLPLHRQRRRVDAAAHPWGAAR